MVAQTWLVLKLTGKGVDLGLLSSCALLPVLVGGPWAGVLVDRVDRRRLLIVTQSLFIGLASLLAVLTATGAIRLWMLFVLAAASGTVNAPDAAARQVYVAELVGRGRLAERGEPLRGSAQCFSRSWPGCWQRAARDGGSSPLL